MFVTKEPENAPVQLSYYIYADVPLPLTFARLCSLLASKSSIIQAKASQDVCHRAICYKCAANLASTTAPSIVLLSKQKEGVFPTKRP